MMDRTTVGQTQLNAVLIRVALVRASAHNSKTLTKTMFKKTYATSRSIRLRCNTALNERSTHGTKYRRTSVSHF